MSTGWQTTQDLRHTSLSQPRRPSSARPILSNIHTDWAATFSKYRHSLHFLKPSTSSSHQLKPSTSSSHQLKPPAQSTRQLNPSSSSIQQQTGAVPKQLSEQDCARKAKATWRGGMHEPRTAIELHSQAHCGERASAALTSKRRNSSLRIPEERQPDNCASHCRTRSCLSRPRLPRKRLSSQGCS